MNVTLRRLNPGTDVVVVRGMVTGCGWLRRCFLLVLAAMSTASLPADDAPLSPVRPPTPAFAVPATKRAWERDRLKIRATLQQLLGDLPPRPQRPSVRVLLREDRGTYTLERFEFDNGAGAIVPGVLLLPKGVTGKLPAILYCHWHGGEYDGGKVELFETKHTPEQPGPALVARGYAVLAIDAYCFGERNGRGPGGPADKGGSGELSSSKFELWAGRSLWGMMLRDDLMALDYLCSRPEVDVTRIGVTGISMGATRSWWLMALDERLLSIA